MPSNGFQTISIRKETYKLAVDLAALLTLDNAGRVSISDAIKLALVAYKEQIEAARKEHSNDATEQV